MGAEASPGRFARRAAVWTVAVAVLFFLYWRQSSFQPANSDGASMALEAWDMGHGNVLLHGWHLADVTFYTTELPQYFLIELVLGLGPWVVHAAGAMTYTLIVLLAALLARGAATGGLGAARALLAAGIIVAPQLSATSTLLLGPAHAGTAVPLLVAWLLIDRAPQRWYVPAGVCLILGWTLVADSLVLVAGIAPLVIAGLVRALRCWPRPPRYEIALAAAGVAAAVLGWLLHLVIRTAGGYSAQPVSTALVTVGQLPRTAWVTIRAVLELFGANVFSAGQGPVFAWLHLAGVALVIAGLVIAFARFFQAGDVVVPVLALGIVLNLLAFLVSRVGLGVASTREIAVVMPYGAVLAGRLTAAPLLRLRLAPLLAALGGGWLAALGYAASWPSAPPADQPLAAWLTAHRLTDGLAGYWDANITTLDTGGRVQVSSVLVNHGKIVPGNWETVTRAYDPGRFDARFFAVRDATVRPSVLAAARATFGPPAQTYRIPGYTIYVWSANLLPKLGPPPPLPGATSAGRAGSACCLPRSLARTRPGARRRAPRPPAARRCRAPRP